jgi:hypothetical protein
MGFSGTVAPRASDAMIAERSRTALDPPAALRRHP